MGAEKGKWPCNGCGKICEGRTYFCHGDRFCSISCLNNVYHIGDLAIEFHFY